MFTPSVPLQLPLDQHARQPPWLLKPETKTRQEFEDDLLDSQDVERFRCTRLRLYSTNLKTDWSPRSLRTLSHQPPLMEMPLLLPDLQKKGNAEV